MKTLLIIGIIYAVRAYYRIEFDYTVNKDLLLWYGRENRDYIIVFKGK